MQSLISTWFERVWNNKEEEAIDTLFHENGTAYGLTEAHTISGIENFKEFYKQYREQTDSFEVHVEKEIIQNQYETALCIVTVERGKEKVCFPAVAMIEIKNGKIFKAWNHFDDLANMLFSGALKKQ